MSDNNRVYQAKVIRDSLEGKHTPSIDEIVKEIILTSESSLKKEEIDKKVELIIGLSLDDSIVGATSNALKSLEKQSIVKHFKHGYWEKA